MGKSPKEAVAAAPVQETALSFGVKTKRHAAIWIDPEVLRERDDFLVGGRQSLLGAPRLVVGKPGVVFLEHGAWRGPHEAVNQLVGRELPPMADSNFIGSRHVWC